MRYMVRFSGKCEVEAEDALDAEQQAAEMLAEDTSLYCDAGAG